MASQIPNQVTAYMLVNNVTDLENIGFNAFTLAQTYALGRDIDARSVESFNPLGMFTGIPAT